MTVAKTFLIVTSISAPNAALHSLADGSQKHGIEFIVIGDEKSPSDFHLAGCRFYDLTKQKQLDCSFAGVCPTGHYSRKNIGYLLALSEGAEIIVETDDDNYPRDLFWTKRNRLLTARCQNQRGWINVYRYFSNSNIWPRGFPLEGVKSDQPPLMPSVQLVDSPIQQGLTDVNPDVDAIYRMVFELPQNFDNSPPVALASGAWCPFNSQNTTWWRDAAPLLYLPSFCTFRMTDIWRSFVAQRIAWENGWKIAFHAPTVWQDRNQHKLFDDFKDEIPGHLHNSMISDVLAQTNLRTGRQSISQNMQICYEALVSRGVVGKQEMPLLAAWLNDISSVGIRDTLGTSLHD